MHIKARRLGAALGALALCAALASFALAHSSPTTTASEQVALDRFCADPEPCVIINGAADPSAGEGEAELMTVGEALAEGGKRPSACPKADAAYSEAGVEPDAFVGPCPDAPAPSAAKRLSRREGSR